MRAFRVVAGLDESLDKGARRCLDFPVNDQGLVSFVGEHYVSDLDAGLEFALRKRRQILDVLPRHGTYLVFFGQLDVDVSCDAVRLGDEGDFFQMVEVGQVDVAGAGLCPNSHQRVRRSRVTGVTVRERWSTIVRRERRSMAWWRRGHSVIRRRRVTSVVAPRRGRTMFFGRGALFSKIATFFVDDFVVREEISCLDVVVPRLPEPRLPELARRWPVGGTTSTGASMLGMFVVFVMFARPVRRRRERRFMQIDFGSDIAALRRTSANVRPDNKSHLRRCLEIKFTADVECTRDIASAAADMQQSHSKVVRLEAAEQTVNLKIGEHDFLHTLGNVDSRFCTSKRDWRHALECRRDSENDVVGPAVDVFALICLESD
jgi:hypothetical protein